MSWTVPYVDYPGQFRAMEQEVMSTVHGVLSKGDLMLRRQLREFEEALAAFVGTKHAVGLSNCTDALHLTLRAVGIGPGDEVITVAHTFVATVAAIHHAGAEPVLVDIGDDHNMDPCAAAAAVTPRTRAILPVHLNGRLCDMRAIMAIAERHNLLVIEDSAQALGGSLDGRRGGAWGLAGCFSFYPAKLLGAYGDAGAMVTDDEELAERVRRLRDHGRMPNGDLAGWSFNCRMDNLQAALLTLKLARLPAWLERRRQLAAVYHEELECVPQVKLPPAPEEGGRCRDVFQNFELEAERRDELANHLRECGIETMIPWGGRAVHQFPALGLERFQLPRTEALFERVIMLPMHPELHDRQAAFTAAAIRRFYAQ